jgi:hypothetical protein
MANRDVLQSGGDFFHRNIFSWAGIFLYKEQLALAEYPHFHQQQCILTNRGEIHIIRDILHPSSLHLISRQYPLSARLKILKYIGNVTV